MVTKTKGRKAAKGTPSKGKASKAKPAAKARPAKSRPAARPAPTPAAKRRPAPARSAATFQKERTHCVATDPFGDPCQTSPRYGSKYCSVHSHLDR